MPINNPFNLIAARTELSRLKAQRDAAIITSTKHHQISELATINQKVIDFIQGLTPKADPCDASSEVPLVMLPVRVETKLKENSVPPVLRVRIYPDAVHIDNLDRTLSPPDIKLGQAYWKALWSDPTNMEAWNHLQHAVGRRAGWVAQATKPLNIGQRGTSATPQFPAPSRDIPAGTVARCLPDRFIVHTHIPGQSPITTRGSAIPPDLPVSPLALGDVPTMKAGKLNIPAGSEWLVDFTAAKQVGMGVEITLPAGTTQIDQLVVVGVRKLVDEEENARDFSELLTSHRFSDGLSFPAPGTLTNNDTSEQEEERSPYRPDLPPGAPQLKVQQAASQTDDELGSMAALLGISSDLLQSLKGSDTPQSTLDSAQKAANTALWFATWAPVLSWISKKNTPGFSPDNIEKGRLFHRDHIRAAGHSPVLRINAQPYGILPVSIPSRWTPTAGEDSAVIAPVINTTLGRWVKSADNVAHVTPDSDLSDEELLEMMGTAPISQGVRVRAATSGQAAPWLSELIGLGPATWAQESAMRKAIFAQYSVEVAKIADLPSLSDASKALPLPLVSDNDQQVINAIIAGDTPEADSVLQALLMLSWEEAKKRSLKAVPHRLSEDTLALLTSEVTRSPDLMMAVHAALEPLSAAPDPDQVRSQIHLLRSGGGPEHQFQEPVHLSQFAPITEAETSLAEVAIGLGTTVEGKFVAVEAVATLLEAYSIRGEIKSAMQTLGKLPTKERHIAVASSLDIASHRVDAWVTALAHSRVKPPRGTDGALTLGAFGYAENIKLNNREPAQGWIQAPSLNHATAAGILSSAHQSNIGAKPETTPFAINLTSTRGAEVRRILEGMKAGQTLGELLGYQIERGLTGTAARFQLSLRVLCPLDPSELSNELGSPDYAHAADAPGALDGLALLKKYPRSELDALKNELGEAPINFYVDADWPEPTHTEWEAVTTVLAAAVDSLDAVSDALLAESVLQYIDGNPARAAAAMDSTGAGGSVDPDLGVFETRQTGEQLTHAVFAAIPATATGWSQHRPRAAAEPRGEAWAASRLGDPTQIIITDVPGTRINLWQAGWAALDLVFSDSLESLERNLRAALPEMADHPLADIRGADWPAGVISITEAFTLAGSLRALLVGGRAVTPEDLVRPGRPAEVKRQVNTQELITRCERLLSGLQGVLDAGEAAFSKVDEISLTVAEADLPGVVTVARGLVAYGAHIHPDVEVPTNVASEWAAQIGMQARYKEARNIYSTLRSPEESLGISEVLNACDKIVETILGDGFRLLPLLEAPNGSDDFATAVLNPVFSQPAATQVSAFLRDHATVHRGVARLAETNLIGRALNRTPQLSVIQFTAHEDNQPAPGTNRWLAGKLAADVPWPAGTATHAVIEMMGDNPDPTGDIAGISFDGWTEMIPFQPDPQAFAPGADDDNPLRGARATTGLAVHADLPSGRAPQVLLSLVSPDGTRWTTDTVVESVLAAMDLAKARMVTLEKTPGDAAILPAVYATSPWLRPTTFPNFAEMSPLATSMKYTFLTEAQ